MAYNWQQSDWPEFKYDLSGVEDALLSIAEKAGRVSGFLDGFPEDMRTEAVMEMMVAEAVKTSEIEGEHLNRQEVMSSIRNNLGFDRQSVRDKRAAGAAELMIAVRNGFAEELTEEVLFAWHRMLMQGNRRIRTGAWRSHAEPMRVISGPAGKEKIHFEAPPSPRVPAEMKRFIEWFNATGPEGENAINKPAVRSAIAHLYFESIHPFEDGNGRIGRAISEKALSQGFGRPVLLSLSKAMEANKKAYYGALQTAQRSNEITPWITYFIDVVLEAQSEAEAQVDFTLKKARFFDRFEDQLNKRQLRVVRRMLEEGPEGFEGGMSAKKYVTITRTSKATATRDLQDLVAKGIFAPIGGGRSTRYELMVYY